MRIYTTNSETAAYGVSYLQWILPTYYCMGLSLTCTIILRSVGQVKIPLIRSIIAFFINVFFNWVFIFGNLGAPRMEIAGAALGTLIARVLSCCLYADFSFGKMHESPIGSATCFSPAGISPRNTCALVFRY